MDSNPARLLPLHPPAPSSSSPPPKVKRVTLSWLCPILLRRLEKKEDVQKEDVLQGPEEDGCMLADSTDCDQRRLILLTACVTYVCMYAY